MTCVVFKTPTLLDLLALTTFGMNVKPNTENPIGFFGTGLKYAIAVLVRNKIPVTIWIGDKQFEFYVKDIEFRDKGFGQVMCRQRNSFLGKWTYIKMPFTTELGKHWELWQAFRELESNTRDENGTTAILPGAATDYTWGEPDCTSIIVDGDAFAETYAKRDEIFLPEGETIYEYTASLQVIDKPSNHIYYRGLRVYDLEKPSRYTYNILEPCDLTEDRTLKYPYSANVVIATWVATRAKEEVVAKVISADPDKFHEGKLEFESVWQTPSTYFLEVMRKKRARERMVLPRASTYYDRYVTPPTTEEELKNKLHYKLQKFLDYYQDMLVRETTLEDREMLTDCVKVLERVDK